MGMSEQTLVEQFLRDREPIDQPFSTVEFAEGAGVPEQEALGLLEDLERHRRVHQDQGGWQTGPPPPPMTVDQG
jgi:hypothetical protein